MECEQAAQDAPQNHSAESQAWIKTKTLKNNNNIQ